MAPLSAHSPEGALHLAVKAVGSQSKFAKLVGVAQPSVWKWLRGNKPLPAEHVLKVEQATGISRHDLRPDLYPHEAPRPPRPASFGDMEPAR